MPEQAFYPVKTISRSANKGRAKRVSWFVLGTSFGIGCALALSSYLHPPIAQIVAQKEAAVPDAVPVASLVTSSSGDTISTYIRKPESEPEATASIPEPKTAKEKANSQENSNIYPLALDLKVGNGDTFINLLTDTGVSYEEAHSIFESIRKVYDPKKLNIGQAVSVQLDKNPDGSRTPIVTTLSLAISPTTSLEITRDMRAQDLPLRVKKVDMPVERYLARAGGRIDSSLYETGMDAGIPAALLGEMINAYSYDVDFQREIKQGDAMDVLYERMKTKDGANAGYGNIIFAELNLGDRALRIYRYTDKSGNADYYNEKGESIRKALLRTPINGAHITSGFGMRNHPILGYSKMHRGVDFAAALGTPIYAAGDGKVEFVGRKGGYGNYLRIKHNDKYASAYAHVSRFAAGITPGYKVKQGQIIAYVGATGMATGPHLHYEILAAGEQVNPANVKFKTGNVLQGKELASFRKTMEQIQAQLTNMPRKTDMAMAEWEKQKSAN